MKKIALFASGGGTNAEEFFKYFKNHPAIQVVALLSNHTEAYALQRAKNHQVETHVFDRKQFRESDEVVHWLQTREVTHVVLAGFLWLIPQNLIQAFPDRIINVHPALLPKFGGQGMYGMKVHEAVKNSGESETGITIHLVNERYDEGQIIFQASCSVMPSDTPETIASHVHALEYAHYPKVVEKWITTS